MKKIIRNEYEKGLNKDNEKTKELVRDINRVKIKEVLKTAGFSEDGESLDKHGFFEDVIEPANKDCFSFRTKDGGFYCSETYRLGYEIIYHYKFFDSIVISVHGYPDATYEFRNINIPDEIMLATSEVEEKFINFLDEKLNTIKDNLDFSNYQNIKKILK